jgi:hypothetical protein
MGTSQLGRGHKPCTGTKCQVTTESKLIRTQIILRPYASIHQYTVPLVVDGRVQAGSQQRFWADSAMKGAMIGAMIGAKLLTRFRKT